MTPFGVRRREAVGQLSTDAQHVGFGDGTACEPLTQRLARDELHDEEVDSSLSREVVDLRDVRMVQLRESQRLLPEAFARALVREKIAPEDLERDVPLEPRVARPVDLPHSARTQRREDFVRTQPGTGRQGHGSNAFVQLIPKRPARGSGKLIRWAR